YIRWIEYCRVGFNPPIKSICYGYMVGQDPPYKLISIINLYLRFQDAQMSPHAIVKKKKKKTMSNTKLKIK
ncbi:hypothetical protein, partial [Glaesserella parasuis]|uniref:hypothetical protein n=1 Tax=Glaesserella parasuis TaxID=738 RepID=UPI001BE471C8